MGMRSAARMPKLTRRSRILIMIALGVIVLLLAGPRLIDAYVDWLWFGELGYRSVFTTMLATRIVVCLVAGVVVGGIVFGGLALAYRTRPVFVPDADNDPVARYRAVVLARLRLVGIGIPAAIGLLAGIVAQSYWARIQLFLHGGDFGVRDPQFGRDLGFYAFELPFYRLMLSYMLVSVFLAFVANLVAHYIFGGIRLSGRTGALSRSARVQLVSLVGVLVLLKAVAYWLDRYELLSHTRGGKPFTGAGYTDINAVLPAKLILMAIALICAAAVFSAIALRDLRIPAIGLVLLLLSSLIVGAGWPLIVEQISVKPNAAQKESEYISRSITATRQAYGLTSDVVTYRNYSGDSPATAQQVAADRATTSNIRLLDPTIVSPAFTQFQQGKNFYYFPDQLSIDRHFATAPLESNAPVLLGLIGLWYSNFFGAQSRTVLPYSNDLSRFPAYLQQLTMESNGKSTRADGSPVSADTGEIFWGEPGTNGQHAFYQLLHQGTRLVPADFIGFAQPLDDLPTAEGTGSMHDLLMSNFFAQTQVLAFGKTAEEIAADGTPAHVVAHKVMPGNRPSTSILASRLTPSVLGQLIALYEHQVFTEGVVWGIDSFDQWGVELGKTQAKALLPVITGAGSPPPQSDSSTDGLVRRYRTERGRAG